MSEIAISVDNISKQYTIGQTIGYHTFRESLSSLVMLPFKWYTKSSQNTDSRYIWALKDISFDVKTGEAIGIIGRNGAGKSTLLKILSRITEPTHGHARLRGRIGSLLEVGTGFHPELTGRENIYLNGAILGMKKREIESKFEEIVEFSGIRTFLDTPLKRFSSGMGVRLAFAVAAHLDPEILLVDEVLAVGDYEFQKKCLGKMQEVSGGGRTVLFVSHNMGAIANLCSKTIWLDHGELVMVGDTREVIMEYLSSASENRGEVTWSEPESAPGNDTVRLKAVRIRSCNQVTQDVLINKDTIIEIDYWNLRDGSSYYTGVEILDKMNVLVLTSVNWPSANLIEDPWAEKPRPKGLYRTTCVIPANFLNNDQYFINVLLTRPRRVFQEWRGSALISFTVHDTGDMKKEFTGRWDGVVRPRLAWSTEIIDEKVITIKKNP